jgi:hypothetical protein
MNSLAATCFPGNLAERFQENAQGHREIPLWSGLDSSIAAKCVFRLSACAQPVVTHLNSSSTPNPANLPKVVK